MTLPRASARDSVPSREKKPGRIRRWRRAAWLSACVLALALSIVALRLDSPLAVNVLAWLVGSMAAVVILWAGFVWLQRRLLWRVGRRLAFSYVLFGLLPFLLSLVLVIVAAYLLSGFFLGHLYRDAAIGLQEELEAVSAFLIQPLEMGLLDPSGLPSELGGAALAYYQDDVRAGGDPRAPDGFPAWLEADDEFDGQRRRSRVPPLVVLPDGSSTLAAAFRRGTSAVVAFYDPASMGQLERELSRRSDVWTQLRRQGETDGAEWTVQVRDAEFVLQPLARTQGGAEREAFFESLGADFPLSIVGVEMAGPLHSFASGEAVSPPVSASLAATQPIVFRHLFSSSGQVDTLGLIAFFIPAFLLFDVFIAAMVMALFMILGLSRAVNRLSAATGAVQAGDFSARIPVRRKDQIGALQRSFNEMAGGLERLIAERTARRALEQELEFAREVQKNLIPGQGLQVEGVEFATFFEPSAAIGGDYFDILELPAEGEGDSGRLGVVIADVAGHGLSAGLRMAMLKAGLLTLVEEGKPARQLIPALDSLVRKASDRVFVTASLSLIDLSTGVVEMTNAGHPPAYLLRDGEIEEILLAGSPLGALGEDYGFRRFELEPGDVMVWLSDGFIEASAADGEVFGYDRTMESLKGSADSAMEVRDRILEEIHRYTEGVGADDDLTLVVMRYQPEAATVATPVGHELLRAAGG
ncbi:MAG: SpoIIE family protein phosphatase [Acidobacteria bacterium]|nr:SpoIIE family protein phosphatase [Acidobacteriota bacterium]